MVGESGIEHDLSDEELMESARMRVDSFNPLDYAVGIGEPSSYDEMAALYGNGSKKTRTVWIFDEGKVPRYQFPQKDIIVTRSLEGGFTKVTARSASAYEPATNINGESSFVDSNFVDGEEIMGAREFVEVLGALNKARVINAAEQDYTTDY